MAFFPCIYFETVQQLYYCLSKNEFRKKTKQFQIEYAIERLQNRTEFHLLLYKLLWLSYEKQFRMIIENPATEPNYLISGQNFPKPTFIDKNRLARGDVFKKPTAYWFINCEMTTGNTILYDKKAKRIDDMKPGVKAGICSEERSMIHPDYARNFICDFILGKEQVGTQLQMFEDGNQD